MGSIAEDTTLITSLKKALKAYRQIFSTIDPYYHTMDLEINISCFISTILNELALSADEGDLGYLVKICQNPDTLPSDLLGGECEEIKDKIAVFIKELENALIAYQNQSFPHLKQNLDKALLHIIFLNMNRIFPKYAKGKDFNCKYTEYMCTNIKQNGQNCSLGKLESNINYATIGKTSKFMVRYKLQRRVYRNRISKDALMKAFDSGKSNRECADMFGCTINVISYYAKKYNLIKNSRLLRDNRLTKDKLEYYLTNMSPAQVLKEYGYNKEYIYGLMRKFGIKCNMRLSSEEIDEAILGLIKEKPCSQLDDLVSLSDISKSAVARSLKRLVENNVIGFGYSTNLEFFDEIALGRRPMDLERTAFNLIKNNPSISADDIVSGLGVSKEGILTLINGLVIHGLIRFGYVVIGANNWNDRGLKLFNSGNYSGSIESFKKGIEIDPSFADCYYNMGKALSSLSLYEEAIESFNNALKINDSNLEVWYGKAVILTKLGKYIESIDCFDQVLKINPEHLLSLHNKGLALYKIGYYDESLQTYDKLLEKDPLKSDIWYNKGLAYKQLRKYEDAIKSYDKALALNPNHLKALNNKGTTLNDLGLYEDALKLFDKIMESYPLDKYILNNRGNVLYHLNKYKEALNCYDKALTFKSNDHIILYNKSIILCCLEKYNEGIECYELAIKINPKFIEAWINRGICFKNLRQYDKAIRCFDEAITISPCLIGVWCYKGNVLIEDGKYSDAEKCYNRAIELDSNSFEAWNGKGLALTKLGYYTDARIAFSKAENLRHI